MGRWRFEEDGGVRKMDDTKSIRIYTVYNWRSLVVDDRSIVING